MKTLKLLLLIFFCFGNSSFAQWTQTGSAPSGGGVTDMVITETGTLVVSTASYNWPTGQNGGIRISTNDGATWIEVFNAYNSRTLEIAPNGYVFASIWSYPSPEALFFSNDNGVSFSPMYSLGTNDNIFSISVPSQNSDTIFLGTRNGVLRSIDYGSSFNPVNNGIPPNSWVRDLAYDSAGTIVAATTNGLFFSTNGGNSWQQTGGIQAGDTIVKLCFDYPLQVDGSQSVRLSAGSNNGNMYAALADSNNSYTFATLLAVFGDGEISGLGVAIISSLNKKVQAVTTYGGNGQNSGFSSSTNNGANWTQMNSGLPQGELISSMSMKEAGNNTIIVYAGMYENTSNGARVFKLEKTIGIQNLSTEIPNGFSLQQNYPNPFNPSTKIKFAIPNSSFVKLAVYDMLGREVSSLVNEQLQPGTYEYEFEAERLNSGVYFYKLESNSFTETKKMLLIK